MKKLVFLLFIIFHSLGVFSQPASGDGTSGNPYSGLITTPWTLSGNKYCGNLQVSSGVFTISAGSTLQFGTDAVLTISGTGVLSAVGNSSQIITFTASGTSWGHIYFNNATATTNSVLSYCNINKGDVSSYPADDYRSYGGGIYAKSSKLTISYCTIENNKSRWGGGIFVGVNSSPGISNCIIQSNTALNGGGGFYFFQYCASVVKNCIVYNNTVTGSTYGGAVAFIDVISASLKLINCTFVSNTAQVHTNGIEFSSSPNAKIINSILWGSSSQYYSANSSSFEYCAIQGGAPSGSTGCIPLNSNNTNSAGPNFVATDGTNWAIQFISPCRDKGTTPSSSVPNDFIDNPRIGNYDIGAYEVLYSRWKTNATYPIDDWYNTLNWEQGVEPGHTGSSGDVVIPSLSVSYAPNISGTITIQSGKYIVLEPGGKATFGTLTNNGTLNLSSDATGMFSLLIDNFSGTGNINSQVYYTGGINNGGYSWHYTAVPKTLSKTVLTSLIVDQNNVNLLMYDDSKVAAHADPKDVNQGWRWHDGYNSTESFSTLYEKSGYNFYRKTTDASTATMTTTSLLTGLGTINLQYSGSGTDELLYGWNLLGNSLTCGLDWSKVTTTGRDAVYYTQDNVQRAYVNDVGVNGGTQYIPPLQGFLVKATGSGQSVDFTNSLVKIHTTQQYYKGVKSNIPLLRLEIRQGALKDETVIRMDEYATMEFDDKYDASKWLSSSAIPQLYSYFSDELYCLNSIPFPETELNIPLAVVLPASGNYTLNKTLIQEIDNYSNVFLKDLTLNTVIDLRNISEYSFYAEKGTLKDRFVLSFVNVSTNNNEVFSDVKNDFNIFASRGVVNIEPLGDEWNNKATINIYEITGKKVLNNSTLSFSRGSVIKIPFIHSNGIYFVEIIMGKRRSVSKINVIN